MPQNPRVSVIVSIFNGEKFLRGFLENVLEQTILDSAEILLLDAQSTDSSAKIISEFSHPSLKYVLLDKRYSIYETWNIGVKMAKSAILTNWNADDRRKFDSLETQTVYMENNPDCDVCYGYTAWSYKANEKFEDANIFDLYPCYEATAQTMMENNSPHCMPFWRKSLHDKFGMFDSSYPTAGDFDFWMRCLEGGTKFNKLFETVGLYYYNPNGLSTNSQTSNMQEGAKIKQKYKHLL